MREPALALFRPTWLVRLLPVGTRLPRIVGARCVGCGVVWQGALVALLPENDARVRRTVTQCVGAIRRRWLTVRPDPVEPNATHPCRCGRCVLGRRSLSPFRPLSVRAPRSDERADCKDPDQAAHHGISDEESRRSPALCLPVKALKVPPGPGIRQSLNSWSAITYADAPARQSEKPSICMDNRISSFGTTVLSGRPMAVLYSHNRTRRARASDRA